MFYVQFNYETMLIKIIRIITFRAEIFCEFFLGTQENPHLFDLQTDLFQTGGA